MESVQFMPQHSQEIAEYLAVSGLFDTIDDEELQQIAKKFHLKTFGAEKTIVTEGETDGDVYILAAGSVRATLYSPSGKEISYQELIPGQFFGELSAIDGSHRSTHVIANENSKVLVITRQKFLELVAEHPAIALVVMQKMASLIRFLCGKVYEFSAMDVSTRIRSELLRIAETKGTPSADGVIIASLPTHQELASRVATHREAVTRELNRLLKSGILRRTEKGKGLIIPDIGCLRTETGHA